MSKEVLAFTFTLSLFFLLPQYSHTTPTPPPTPTPPFTTPSGPLTILNETLPTNSSSSQLSSLYGPTCFSTFPVTLSPTNHHRFITDCEIVFLSYTTSFSAPGPIAFYTPHQPHQPLPPDIPSEKSPLKWKRGTCKLMISIRTLPGPPEALVVRTTVEEVVKGVRALSEKCVGNGWLRGLESVDTGRGRGGLAGTLDLTLGPTRRSGFRGVGMDGDEDGGERGEEGEGE